MIKKMMIYIFASLAAENLENQYSLSWRWKFVTKNRNNFLHFLKISQSQSSNRNKFSKLRRIFNFSSKHYNCGGRKLFYKFWQVACHYFV